MARLFRVIVPVTRIEAAAGFYAAVLGHEGRRVSPGRHYFDCEGTILACYDPVADGDESQAQPLPEPVYLAVDDLEAAFRRAAEAGATFPAETPAGVGPLGQIARRPWGERSFYLRDPFGNPLCFVDRQSTFTGVDESTPGGTDPERPSPAAPHGAGPGAPAVVRAYQPDDLGEWLRMRRALWPDLAGQDERADAAAWLAQPGAAVFVAVRPTPGGLAGFAEVGTRPYADGCDTSPVAYLEGWYVDADIRRTGVGAALLRACEDWARERGYRELASDALLENLVSYRAHLALGFTEVERAVHFRKGLDQPRS